MTPLDDRRGWSRRLARSSPPRGSTTRTRGANCCPSRSPTQATGGARVRRRGGGGRGLARARLAARHRARRREWSDARDAAATRGYRRCRFCSHARRDGREGKPLSRWDVIRPRLGRGSAPASPVCREKNARSPRTRRERTSDASPPLATRTRAGAPRRRRSTRASSRASRDVRPVERRTNATGMAPAAPPRLAG